MPSDPLVQRAALPGGPSRKASIHKSKDNNGTAAEQVETALAAAMQAAVVRKAVRQ